MSSRWKAARVCVYRYPVDMRKQIDGLAELIGSELNQDPADRTAWVFVSRCKKRVKVLIWHLNGYWLLYKRLESQRFHWPDWFDQSEYLELTDEQLDYLLDGYNLNGMRPHQQQHYARHF